MNFPVLPNFCTLTSTNGLPRPSPVCICLTMHTRRISFPFTHAHSTRRTLFVLVSENSKGTLLNRGISVVNSRNRKTIAQHAACATLSTRHVIGSRVHGRRNGIATVRRLVPLGLSTFGGPFFSISVPYRRFLGPVTFIGVCARRYLYGNITNPLLHIRW